MKSLLMKQTLLVVIIIISQALQAQDIQTIQLRPGPQNGYDCDIRNDDPTPNWLSDDFMANAWSVNGNPFIQRGLIRFDISQIPVASTIVKARLSLFCNTSSGHQQLQAGANAYYLKRIIENWDQTTANWSNQPAVTNDSAVILSRSQNNTQDYPNIDLTNFVTFWHSNPTENFGLSIQLVEELMFSCMVFESSNHFEESKRPLLVIEYKACAMPYGAFIHTSDELDCQFAYSDTTTTEWHWNFGDGSSSELQNPTHNYQEAGSYIVHLTAINSCCSTTMQDTIVVCRKPLSDFTYRINDQTVNFTCLTENIDEWHWDFGNGSFSNLENPVYSYLQNGNYQVCLMVNNSCGSHISCQRLSIEDLGIIQTPNGIAKIETTPNPTTGEVKISVADEQSVYNIVVCTTSGKRVKVIENLDCKTYTLDLSDVESGTYLVRVVTSKGEYTRLVIKQ